MTDGKYHDDKRYIIQKLAVEKDKFYNMVKTCDNYEMLQNLESKIDYVKLKYELATL